MRCTAIKQYIDAADNDDIVRLALHAIEGGDEEPVELEDSDDFEGDTDQGEEDISEFDGRGYRTRGGI